MTDEVMNVLFLCTGNSARSILAEALLNRRGKGRFRAFSAGSAPKGRVHPLALELLENNGFDTDTYLSKSWDEFAQGDAPSMDFVFTVCDNSANETCPVWPGRPVSAHWGLPDPDRPDLPVDVQRRLFLDIWKELDNRIRRFVELPVEKLEKSALQAELDVTCKNYTE